MECVPNSMTEVILPEEIGSWKAVVTSDGVRHIRGHFSKNGSFNIKNHLTGGLLWYSHKCMVMMSLKMSCMQELLSPWRVFWRMSAIT